MKVKLNIVLLVVLFFASCAKKDLRAQSNLSVEMKKIIVGRWVLSSDKKFIIDIHEDSVIYIYDGKITDKRASEIIIGDSIPYYKFGENNFNFMNSNGEIYKGIVIKEYDTFYNDTILNKVIYMNTNGMDMMLGNRSVSFKRIK